MYVYIYIYMYMHVCVPSKSIKTREPALSAMFHPEVVFQEKIPGKGGKKLWLANRAAIKALYTAL